ncbi:acetyl transferase [Streptococcus pneumoniae]|uniref:acyltransferase n=1 Tax=Streptococcus pneumoniae TaxID=1313 RepID=UPI000B59356C|nr:transferase [Streptococcus pneumoniae]SNL77570.1 acetyl transferase [Streptococcus pneumoniae]
MESKISILDRLYSWIYIKKLKKLGAIIEENVVICFGAKLFFNEECLIQKDTVIGRFVLIEANRITIGNNCLFFPRTLIYSKETFSLGTRGKISKDCIFRANKINIGREFWCNEAVRIGEGGWNQKSANIKIGDYQFIGPRAQINVSDSVELMGYGGLGIETMIFTHGAGHGQSATDGFYAEQNKVIIQKNVSILTRAIILPGVIVSQGTTVAANAIVTKSFPKHSLIGGVPARYIGQRNKEISVKEQKNIIVDILKEGLGTEPVIKNNSFCFEKFNENITFQYDLEKIESTDNISQRDIIIFYQGTNKCHKNYSTCIDLKSKTISGRASKASEFLRDKFRRKGIILNYKNYSPFSLNYDYLIINKIEV